MTKALVTHKRNGHKSTLENRQKSSADKHKKGNFERSSMLLAAGVMAKAQSQDVSATKLDDCAQVFAYHVRATVVEISKPQRILQLRQMTFQQLAPVIQILRSHIHVAPVCCRSAFAEH